MTDVTITLTLEEAKALLHSAERDVNEYHVEAERAVLDRLAKKIEDAEMEELAYDAASRGEAHWAREQPYQGPSRYAHPSGDEDAERH
jgi:hypothetical protein